MKNYLYIVSLLSIFCIQVSMQADTPLTVDQFENIAEFQNELTKIAGSAHVDWTNNNLVSNLIENIERVVQQADKDTIIPLKQEIKSLFAHYGIAVRFTQHNLLEKMKQIKVKRTGAAQSLDAPLGVTEYEWTPSAVTHMSPTWWKQYLARQHAKKMKL